MSNEEEDEEKDDRGEVMEEAEKMKDELKEEKDEGYEAYEKLKAQTKEQEEFKDDFQPNILDEINYNKVRYSDYLSTALRMWNNQLPIRYDTWHSCTNRCLYCFARVLEYGSFRRLGLKYDPRIGRVGDIKRLKRRLERIFIDKEPKSNSFLDWAFVKKWFTEIGTMGEPCQPEEAKFGVTTNFMKLFKRFKLPMYMCTKGNLLVDDEKFFDRFVSLKDNGLVADVSLISIDEESLKKFEPRTPTVQERLDLIDRLTNQGVNTTISLRPFIKGTSDIRFEELIEELSKRGPQSIHIRQFYLTGNLLQHPYWKKWKKENAGILQKHGPGVKYKKDYLNQWFEKAEKIADDYNVAIVGGSKYSHKKRINHKAAFDKMDNVDEYLFPYGINPVWKKIREYGVEEPQIMRYPDYFAHVLEQDDPFLKAKLKISPQTYPLIYSGSCQKKPRISNLHIRYKDLAKKSIWNGWKFGNPETPKAGGVYLVRAGQIHTVKNGDDHVTDENGDKILFYDPQEDFDSNAVQKKEVKKMVGDF